MHMVKYNSEKGIEFTSHNITKDFNINNHILSSAIASGMVAKNGNGYKFLKPITRENIIGIIAENTRYQKEQSEKSVSKKANQKQQPQIQFEQPKREPIEIYEELPPMVTLANKIDALSTTVRNIERMLINLGCK